MLFLNADIQVAAYYHWLQYGDDWDTMEHWLAGKFVLWAINLWSTVEDIRKQKEIDGYTGPLTVGGRPPVYVYEYKIEDGV